MPCAPYTPPFYSGVQFRQQFPEFANTTAYPDFVLALAWNMGGNWLNQEQPPIWGLPSGTIQIDVTNSDGGDVTDSGGSQVVSNWTLTPLQQAADLMAAVLVKTLFGPASNGYAGFRGSAGVSGPLTSASDESTSASYKLPEFGSSTFTSLLLSAAPYGPLLLALLRAEASVGPYIGSGRMSFVPP